ncbi:MAG: M48 family metallopeptidase [Bacteroidetes bacterium]|nr:M48 family metallopeptidase [Bacteroidota bacterium]
MSSSIWMDLLKLLALFGIIWLVFVFVDIFPDDVDLNISIEKEEKLGELIMEEILERDPTFKKNNSEVLDSAIFILKKRLVLALDSTFFNYNIQVIENPLINAFTLPGGNIIVFSGLIGFAESPEELAAVLAHEIGHVEQRHVINKLAKELGVAILFSVFAGGDAYILTDIARQAASSVFDRKQEKEADTFAMELLEKAKINPRSIALFFRRLEKENLSYMKELEILMTHPHNNSRIKAAMEYELPEDFKSDPIDLDWEKIQEEATGSI